MPSGVTAAVNLFKFAAIPTSAWYVESEKQDPSLAVSFVPRNSNPVTNDTEFVGLK